MTITITFQPQCYGVGHRVAHGKTEVVFVEARAKPVVLWHGHLRRLLPDFRARCGRHGRCSRTARLPTRPETRCWTCSSLREHGATEQPGFEPIDCAIPSGVPISRWSTIVEVSRRWRIETSDYRGMAETPAVVRSTRSSVNMNYGVVVWTHLLDTLNTCSKLHVKRCFCVLVLLL